MKKSHRVISPEASGTAATKRRFARVSLVLAALMASCACFGEEEHTIFVVTGPHQDLPFHYAERQSLVVGTLVDGYVRQLREHIEMIEQHPDARFCMGNTYNTKDFVERRPDLLPRLKRLMAEGKIDTPAQWVGWEPNWYSGELLVRNTIGPKWWAMETLDYEPRWAQLNDVPATAIQYPQILAKARVDFLQIHDHNRIEFDAPEDPFLLVGLDGSSVIGYAPYGDYYGWLPCDDPDASDHSHEHVSIAHIAIDRKTPWETVREGILKGPASDFGAFGDRLMLATEDVGTSAWGSRRIAEFAQQWNADPETRKVCRIVPGTEQEFARLCRDLLDKQAWEPKAFVGRTSPWPWAGLPWHQVMAIHRARAETLLPTVEKLASINELLGLSSYPAGRINEAWERMTWVTDHNWGFTREHRETCVAAYQLARGLLHAELRRLASHVSWVIRKDKGIPVVVFNPLNWSRTGLAEIQVQVPRGWKPAVIDHTGRRVLSQVLQSALWTNTLLGKSIRDRASRLEGYGRSVRLIFQANKVPALGYKTFYIVHEGQAGEAPASDLTAGPAWLENAHVRVEVDGAGRIQRIFDKSVGREMVDLTCHPFVGVVGYTRGGETAKLFNLTKTSARLVESGPLLATLELRGEYESTPVITWIAIMAGSPNIDIYATVAPEAESGARLVFTMPWNVDIGRAHFGVPYGSIPVYTDQAGNRKVNFSRHSPKTGFVSRGKWFDGHQPGLWGKDIQKWISLGDEAYSVDIGHDNLETRVFFRAIGAPVTHLSSGPPPYDRWRLVIRGHRGNWRTANTPRFGWEVSNPLLAMEPAALGRLPREQSFASVASDKNDVVLTVFKKAHDGRGYVARYYETLDADVETTLRLNPLLGLSRARASHANLLEQRLKPLSASDGAYRLPTKGFAIETVRWDVPVPDRPPGRAR